MGFGAINIRLLRLCTNTPYHFFIVCVCSERRRCRRISNEAHGQQIGKGQKNGVGEKNRCTPKETGKGTISRTTHEIIA